MRLGGITYVTPLKCFDSYIFTDRDDGPSLPKHVAFWKQNIVLRWSVVWCFSDRASWIDYELITNFDALIII